MQRDEKGKIIFQYTLSGMGEIDIARKIYPLPPGTAFFVDIPSRHRYYFPEKGEGWEFIFLTIYGDEAKRCFEFVKNKIGQVFSLKEQSPPVQHLFYLLEKSMAAELKNAYDTSAHAYTFIMKLMDHILHPKTGEWPEAISRTVSFIQEHYREPLILEDLIEVARLSKFHFIRQFQQCTNVTPMKFVTKVRIEKAMKLLKETDLTLEEIAGLVGYANGNYFSKVFRSVVGVSPGKYRRGKEFIPFDQIIMD